MAVKMNRSYSDFSSRLFSRLMRLIKSSLIYREVCCPPRKFYQQRGLSLTGLGGIKVTISRIEELWTFLKVCFCKKSSEKELLIAMRNERRK